jgi:hypothetical protein
MSRLFVIVPVIVVALDIFSIIDIITIDERRVRGLPKVLWVAVVVLLPLVGVILWFTIGRARGDDSGGGGGGQRRVVAPDDDPNFLRNLRRDEEADERIRKLEQELSELDDDPPKD